MNIYLDIETIPGQSPDVKQQIASTITAPATYKKAESIAEWERDKKPEAVEEAWLKTSFDGAMGHIAVVSLAIDDQAPITIYRPDYGTPETERFILTELYRHLSEASGRLLAGGTRSGSSPVIIGHNVLDFDLRFIFQRSVMLGVRPPSFIPFDAKPWDKTVFDTMTAWAGVRNRVNQDKLCKAFGIDGKGTEIGEEIDGSKVWEFVKSGRIDDVAKYCAGDVERVRRIHQRLTFQSAA
jgi:hypothetical protein